MKRNYPLLSHYKNDFKLMGKAMVININKYSNEKDHPERIGSEVIKKRRYIYQNE